MVLKVSEASYGDSIGINTSEPISCLDIQGMSSDNSLRLTSLNSSNTAGIVMTSIGVQNFSLGVKPNGHLVLNNGNNFAGSDILDITSGGTMSVSGDFLNMPSHSSAPSDPVAGSMYFNTSDSKMKYFNGSAWISLG